MGRIIITKRQKKILLMAGILALAFVIFISFIYIPMRRRLVQLKNDLSFIEMEINQIRAISGEGKSLEKAIDSLKAKLEEMNKKFPEREEAILRELSDLAARLEIEVISTKPSKKKTITDIDSSPVSIKGSLIQEMSISMKLKTSYRKLGEFLKVMNEESPVFVRVDHVHMMAPLDKTSSILDIDLDLDAFLILQGVK